MQVLFLLIVFVFGSCYAAKLAAYFWTFSALRVMDNFVVQPKVCIMQAEF
jgi:hypothetical protein